MLTQRLLRAGGLLTLGGAKPDSSLFIRAPRGGLFWLGTVVMVNTRASRDTWMWARLLAQCSLLHLGLYQVHRQSRSLIFFLSSPVLILLSSDNQAVKFLNVNAKSRSQSRGFVCKTGNSNHETIKHALVVR